MTDSHSDALVFFGATGKNQDPIRLVLADVDGTLVTQQKVLTSKAKEAVLLIQMKRKLRSRYTALCLELN
jgi:hypothetical protein